MKKLLFAFSAIAMLAMASCSSKSADNIAATEEVVALSVDSVMANPDNFVNDTISVEGVVSHLCKHGGKKAFLLGTGEDILIRCEATEQMGGFFPQETIHHPMLAKGILRETRIDEDVVKQLEAAHEAQVAQLAEQLDSEQLAQTADNPGGCETERKAQGQGDIDSFAAQMADYRAKIADRAAREGKSYLSQYYLETISYEILPE